MIHIYKCKKSSEPGHTARSKCPATVALSSLRDCRKLALRAQTVRQSFAPFR